MHFDLQIPFSSPEHTILLACGRNRELWEQPFQACAIDADWGKPDGQNSVISFVISKWLLPELSFSDRWSRGTEALGTRLYRFCLQITVCSCVVPFTCFAANNILLMGNWNHVLERNGTDRFPELPGTDQNMKTSLVIE